MTKVIVGAFASLDGVMQAPGGPTEDPTKGFQHGGWVVPYFDEVFGEEVNKILAGEMALLLGRKTYEIFAAHWPFVPDDNEDAAIAKLFKRISKYCVSRSGDVDTSWPGSVLLRDVDAVRRLKEQGGPDLVTQGSTELVHALLAADLVDELKVFTVPVILGTGKKLFADGSAPHTWKLLSNRVSGTGLVISHYAKSGNVSIGDTALGAPSAAEEKRQARMTREG